LELAFLFQESFLLPKIAVRSPRPVWFAHNPTRTNHRESRGECQNNDFDLNRALPTLSATCGVFVVCLHQLTLCCALWLAEFLEELNATLNIEPVELSMSPLLPPPAAAAAAAAAAVSADGVPLARSALGSRNNSGNKKKKRKVQDNNNNQESSPSGLLAPALDESGDPLLQSQNATNKYSVRTLLANIRDHQDEHEAEMEEEPDEECDLVLNSALFGKASKAPTSYASACSSYRIIIPSLFNLPG